MLEVEIWDLQFSQKIYLPTRIIIVFMFLIFRLMVHIKQPEMEVSTFKHILSPFKLSLWFTVIIFIIVLSAFLAIIWKIHPGFEHSFSMFDSWFYIYGAFCQQGKHICLYY